MNEEMSQFLDVFLEEATEQIDLLERDILRLETAESDELVQGIFRAAHTLKGSSRAMGFMAMGELTHAMEDVFDKLRRHTLTVSQEMADALFAALDTLKAMKEEIADGGKTTRETAGETARLRAVLEGERGRGRGEEGENIAPPPPQVWGENNPNADRLPLIGGERAISTTTPNGNGSPQTWGVRGAETIQNPNDPTTQRPHDPTPNTQHPTPNACFALTEAEALAIQQAGDAGLIVYRLDIETAADCLMKSVRALMVLQALDAAGGSVLASLPDEEGLENEAFETTFSLLVATGEPPALLCQIASDINEIEAVSVGLYETNIFDESLSVPVSPPIEFVVEEAAPVLTLVETATAAPPAIVPSETAVTAEQSRPAPRKAAQVAQTIRVDVTRLDSLLNLVGELVIDRTRIAQLGSQFEKQYASNGMIEALNETAAHIGRITDELQEQIMKARMLPIDNVFSRFPRMIRDLAQNLGKDVHFEVEGGETEVDRSVIEVIGDPLIHMLRNSVDHGIELPQDRTAAGKSAQGQVILSAHHEENYIVIEVRDDGRGIDPNRLRKSAISKGMMTEDTAVHLSDKEALNLIFAHGFTTAQTLSDVSGRGVGMDIVRSNLHKLGALIELNSVVGQGTVFTVKLPLTLAIIRGLLVRVGSGVYALPLGAVVETLKIEERDIHLINHREAILQRGRVLPILRLHRLFAPCPTFGASTVQVSCTKDRSHSADDNKEALSEKPSQPRYLVVVGVGMKQVGLMVDSLIGEQEVVIKSLGRFLGEVRGISGATILGNGSVALIVDINGLMTFALEEKETSYAA